MVSGSCALTSKEQATNQLRQCQRGCHTDGNADACKRHAVTQHQPPYILCFRTQRHANTELAGAETCRMCPDSINPNGRQKQRDSRKNRYQQK